MSTKNVPPYTAHFDGNQVPSMMAVEGTQGTSDSGGTAKVIPVGANPATGALYVQDLSGAAGTTNVLIVGGTFNAGTVTVGSIANIGVVHNAGTLASGSLSNLAMLHAGTVVVASGTVTTTLALDTGTITTGSLTNLAGFHSGTITTGSLTNLANLVNGSVNVLTGTIQSSGTTTGVGVVSALTTGSLSNVAMVHAGTVVQASGTLTTQAAGTLNTLGTVGVVNNIVTGTLASVKINNTPVGSSVLSTHTLGTGGGTFVGTLVAPVGAGTFLYLAGLSVICRSGGTIDCGIANNVAGTTGAGVYARGFFPVGGGIARDFNPAINLGTNGTLAYFIVTAGTADFTVNYWVAP